MPTVLLTLTITGVLTEHGGGLTDPVLLRRAFTVLTFVAGALCGALLILHVGITASLALGLGVIVAVAVAAHRVSQTSGSWAATR